MQELFKNLKEQSQSHKSFAAVGLADRIAKLDLTEKFARAFQHQVDMENVVCDFDDEEYRIEVSWYWDYFEIGLKLLPAIRKITESPFKEDWVTTEGKDVLAVTVKVESGTYEGLKFRYTKPAPTTGDCKVEEVEYPATTRFELVCNKP